MMPYPHARDIILLDFDPQSGHEIKKKRPALVLSNDAFNRLTGLAMVAAAADEAVVAIAGDSLFRLPAG